MAIKPYSISSPRPEANPALERRGQHRKARMAAAHKPRTGIRVTAANDDFRRVLKHPSGIGFPQGGGSVEWPDDRFTRRRIRDGSVTVEQIDTESKAESKAK
jgi:hypothetical protein